MSAAGTERADGRSFDRSAVWGWPDQARASTGERTLRRTSDLSSPAPDARFLRRAASFRLL